MFSRVFQCHNRLKSETHMKIQLSVKPDIGEIYKNIKVSLFLLNKLFLEKELFSEMLFVLMCDGFITIFK